MARTRVDETREGVDLTNLDQPLFEGAGATKREHIDYLDGVADRILPALRDRPLSVIRTTRGQAPFFQKNLPDYTPEWVARVSVWAEASHRDVSYALCNDRRTLLWFGNQRAVEFHPALAFADRLEHITHLVLDLDPPGDDFRAAVAAARLVREALAGVGLSGALKTSGAKGLHVFVPIIPTTSPHDAAAATRALAQRAEQLDPAIATTAFIKEDRDGKVFVDATRTGGATVVAAYSPRARAGVPVSYPVDWDDLDDVSPRDFTIKTAVAHLGDADPWAEAMPEDQELPPDLLAEGHEIPIPRVAAMHEGKRRRAKERKA
jgi:DNA ligase D